MVSILSFKADPPTFKKLGFMKAGARFPKNQGLGSKDALDGFWGSLGLVFGALGSLLGAHFPVLGDPGGTPNFQNVLVGPP